MPEDDAVLWKDTGVNRQFLKPLINNQVCLSTEQYFQSCRKALTEGARFAQLTEDPDFKDLTQNSKRREYPFEAMLDKILPPASPELWAGLIVNAQLSVFDPYARLVPTAYFDQLGKGEDKTFFGSGIVAEATAAGLFVYDVLPDSAAAHVRIQPHDRITALEGQEIDSLSKAYSALSFIEGGGRSRRFKLEVRRGESNLGWFKIQTSPLIKKRMTSSKIKYKNKQFLYLKINSFFRGVCVEAAREIENSALSMNGLVLDLRFNRGGFTDEGECLARLFVGENKRIFTREYFDSGIPAPLNFSQEPLPEKSVQVPQVFSNLPLTVLVNAESASASEIVAGALQDYGRAWIVGTRTFGKGSTQFPQTVQKYPNLKIFKTISHYKRPSGAYVQGMGVSPNFEQNFIISDSPQAQQFKRESNLPIRWTDPRIEEVKGLHECLLPAINRETLDGVEMAIGHFDPQANLATAVLICSGS